MRRTYVFPVQLTVRADVARSGESREDVKKEVESILQEQACSTTLSLGKWIDIPVTITDIAIRSCEKCGGAGYLATQRDQLVRIECCEECRGYATPEEAAASLYNCFSVTYHYGEKAVYGQLGTEKEECHN